MPFAVLSRPGLIHWEETHYVAIMLPRNRQSSRPLSYSSATGVLTNYNRPQGAAYYETDSLARTWSLENLFQAEAVLRRLFKLKGIDNLPVLDSDERVVNVAIRTNLGEDFQRFVMPTLEY